MLGGAAVVEGAELGDPELHAAATMATAASVVTLSHRMGPRFSRAVGGVCWMLVPILASGMRTIGRVLTRWLRPVRWLTGFLVCSIALAACSSGVSSVHSSAGNELKYGASPEQNSKITYQPDVVFVGGANSVLSVSADGLIWTISGSAPNVNELRPGKIMFASSLGVGRVLKVSQQGANKEVVLGPVTITDVIRDGNFSSSAPIPLNAVEAYTVPSQPGLLTETADVNTPASGGAQDPSGTEAQSSVQLASAPVNSTATAPEPHSVGSDTVTLPPVHFVSYEPGQHAVAAPPGQVLLTAAPDTLPAPSPSPPPASVGHYQLDPFCCRSGLGVSVVYNNKGLLVKAKVTLHLDVPTVSFRLGVAGGKLTAAIELHGAAGISVGFEADSTSGLAGNVANQRVQIPVEFSFPVRAGPLPLMIDFDQVFGMDTAFTAKNSFFKANGDYSFGGTLGFGIVNGIPTVYTPHTLTPTTTMTSTMGLASVGPASMVIAYAAKLSVGIGLEIFQTGPWYELTFAVGAYDGGISSEFQCKQVSLALSSQYGIGYRMPKPVEAAINAFLSVLHVSPIHATGGLVGPSITAIKKSSTFPPIAACA